MRISIFPIFFMLVCGVRGETPVDLLTFDSPRVVLIARPDQTSIEARYQFCNRTDKVVRIEKIQPGCGCTQAVTDKMEVQPGECGSILAVVALQDIQSNKVLEIKLFNEGQSVPSTLILDLRIPASFYLIEAPRLLIWERGTSPTPKRAMLKLNSKYDLPRPSFESNNKNFDVRLIQTDKSGEYWIEIEPKDTSEKQGAIIRPNQEAFNRYDDFSVWAYIK